MKKKRKRMTTSRKKQASFKQWKVSRLYFNDVMVHERQAQLCNKNVAGYKVNRENWKISEVEMKNAELSYVHVYKKKKTRKKNRILVHRFRMDTCRMHIT